MNRKSPLASLKHWRTMLSGRVPGQAVIQYTTRCNASCNQCGMRVQNGFERTSMDPTRVRRLIDGFADRGVAAISFTGGEPLLHLDEILDLARYAGERGISYIRTGTNGFIFKGADKPGFEDKVAKVAAAIADSPINTFWISLDSADPATHEANRGLPGVVEGLHKGLAIFHEHGIYPAANLGINRLTGGPGLVPGPARNPEEFDAEDFRLAFRQAFRRFYSFALELGFTTVNACYPMSMEDGSAVYAATSAEDMIRFTPEEKAAMYWALSETIPEFRHRLRIFTPRSALRALMRQQIGLDKGKYPCRGGIDFFFVEADTMDVFPCGYRGGDNLGKAWDLDMAALNETPWCEKCDWECFRDPSVMAAPLLALRNPFRFYGLMTHDRTFGRLWREDMRYYRACGWCNARVAPDYGRMARFAPSKGQGGQAPERSSSNTLRT